MVKAHTHVLSCNDECSDHVWDTNAIVQLQDTAECARTKLWSQWGYEVIFQPSYMHDSFSFLLFTEFLIKLHADWRNYFFILNARSWSRCPTLNWMLREVSYRSVLLSSEYCFYSSSYIIASILQIFLFSFYLLLFFRAWFKTEISKCMNNCNLSGSSFHIKICCMVHYLL